MKVINGKPPNYVEICEHFDIKDNEGVVFTYGNALYIPSGKKPPKDLMSHEQTHERQQREVGVKEWWAKYFKDPKWRMEQELEAYQYQYRYARKNYSSGQTSQLLDRIATDLSGKMYGNIVTKAKATKLIKEG